MKFTYSMPGRFVTLTRNLFVVGSLATLLFGSIPVHAQKGGAPVSSKEFKSPQRGVVSKPRPYALGAVATLQNANLRVGINDDGRFAPDAGIGFQIASTSTPGEYIDMLTPGCPAEAYGVTYTNDQGTTTAVRGSDCGPLDSGPFSVVSFTANTTSATSVANIGDSLSLKQTYFLNGPVLNLVVTMTNTGVTPMTDVRYHRVSDVDSGGINTTVDVSASSGNFSSGAGEFFPNPGNFTILNPGPATYSGDLTNQAMAVIPSLAPGASANILVRFAGQTVPFGGDDAALRASTAALAGPVNVAGSGGNFDAIYCMATGIGAVTDTAVNINSQVSFTPTGQSLVVLNGGACAGAGYTNQYTLTADLQNITTDTIFVNPYFQVVGLRERNGTPPANPFRLITADDFNSSNCTGGLMGTTQAIPGPIVPAQIVPTVFDIAMPQMRQFVFFVSVFAQPVGGTASRARSSVKLGELAVETTGVDKAGKPILAARFIPEKGVPSLAVQRVNLAAKK